MKLRVGLIGLGSTWQTRHAPILRAMNDRYEVRAVCEQVAHRAELAAQEFGARVTLGFRSLVQREDIDAVLMLAPQWYGPLPIMAACDAGKAVYCAVALDVSIEEARRIKQRVEKAGVAFMAEFPKRHAPATLRLKELIATRLGPPRLLFCHQRQTVGDPAPSADRKRDLPLHNLIELVDWCRFVVGDDPQTVTGIAHPSAVGNHINDYEMLSLKFAAQDSSHGPVTAQISCGHYLPSAWPEAVAFRRPAALQVVCENGVAFVDLPAAITWFDTAGRHLESLESERPVGEQLFAQFFRAVTSLVQRTSDLEDAYRSMSIVLAGRKSQVQGGLPVEFDA